MSERDFKRESECLHHNYVPRDCPVCLRIALKDARLAESAAVERAAHVEKLHNECHDDMEKAQARAARLAEAIEKAPHGIGCSFVAWCGPGTSRAPGPCDCFKRALNAPAPKVADQVKR